MKKTFVAILALMVSALTAQAQILTDSNLPIVVIETDGGAPIPDEPKVLATMKIIWHEDGSRNFLADTTSPQFLNYNGRIGIERRGYSSQMASDKKPYSLTTLQADDVSHNNVSVLGMPKENDWILNSLAFDQTGMRDVMAYELSNQIGQYASRCQYCELILNGDYRGLYVFMEKIKPDKGRVNIEKMDTTCNQPPEVTGGYIVQANRSDNDPLAWQMLTYLYYWSWPIYTEFIHHYPKHDHITETQADYIHNVFLSLEEVAHNHNANVTSGIPSVIDIPTFIDFMMMAEFTSNVDVYHLSTFFHKDRDGKLRAGPIWDYNLAFGYDAFGDRSGYDVWQFDNGDNTGPRFWKDLFNTFLFRCHLAKRWLELSENGMPFDYDRISSRIDEIDTLIAEAVGRDNQRWNNMPQHESYLNEMKEWIQLRIDWLNANVGSCEACSDVELPPLVISKINYHPQDHWGVGGDRLEFIEISNNGDEEVDLTGFYFRELGISYRFPANAKIGPNEALVLCSDSMAFSDFYNTKAFGQYMRNLSNKAQNLVLADAWGNIIDEVHYTDSLPWPTEADGNGGYLELIDLDLDNSLPENWTVGHDLTFLQETAESQWNIYPNPTQGILIVQTLDATPPPTGTTYQITNLLGQTVSSGSLVARTLQIDVSRLPTGIYVIKTSSKDGTTLRRKFIKE